jgi:hypothetical protein
MRTVSARYVTLVIVAVAVAALAACALPVGAAHAAKLTEHRFTDGFAELDDKYWGVEKDGALVGTALGRLEVLLPASGRAAIAPPAGFAIMKDSYFGIAVDYHCLKFPPACKTDVALSVTVRDQKGKTLLTIRAFRWSSGADDAFSDGEDYGITVYDWVKDENHDYRTATDDKSGSLGVERTRSGFIVSCVGEDGQYELHQVFSLPSVRHIGRVSWRLVVGRISDEQSPQQVLVAYDDFRVWSEKGFAVPKKW